MIDELKKLLTEFPGPTGRTRCFAHIINLIAKTVIRQFDVPTAEDKALADEVLKELKTLAGDIEAEELIARAIASRDDTDDDVEGWIDEREGMDQWELAELELDVQPVRTVLVKVGITVFPIMSQLTITAALAPQGVVCNKKLNHHHPAKMVRYS